MAVTKKQSISKRKRAVQIIVLPLLIVALLLFGAVQLIRISSLENSVSRMGMESFMNTINAYYNPLPIDGLHKQSYIPELNIVLPYDSQLSSALRYMVNQDDTSTDNGTVQIITTGELRRNTWNNVAMTWRGCRMAFFVSIGANDLQDNLKEISQKVLQDGRKMEIYASTLKDCQAFITSADGGTVVDMLQRAESY